MQDCGFEASGCGGVVLPRLLLSLDGDTTLAYQIRVRSELLREWQ